MNQKRYFGTGLMVGSILGALVCGGIVIALTHQPQPTPMSSACPQGFTCETAPAPESAATSTAAPAASGTITLEEATFNRLDAQLQTLNAYLPLLKAIRSGNFSISGNNISIPLSNGSSTDLMSALNSLQGEIGK
jgi:hypothetical protein